MRIMVRFLVTIIALILFGLFYKVYNNHGLGKKRLKTGQLDSMEGPCGQSKNPTIAFPLDLNRTICTIYPKVYPIKKRNGYNSPLEIFAVAKPETVGTLKLNKGITFLGLRNKIKETKIPAQAFTGLEDNIGGIPAQLYFPHSPFKDEIIKFIGKRSLFTAFLDKKKVERQMITGDLNKIIRFVYPADVNTTMNYIGVYDYQADILEVGYFDSEGQVSPWVIVKKNLAFSVRDELLFNLDEEGNLLAYDNELKSTDHPFIKVFQKIFESSEKSFVNLEIHPTLPIAFITTEQDNEQTLWVLGWQNTDNPWAIQMLTAKEIYGLELSPDHQWVRFQVYNSKSELFVVRINPHIMDNKVFTEESAHLLFQNLDLLDHDDTEIYSFAWINKPSGLAATTREGSLYKWVFPE